MSEWRLFVDGRLLVILENMNRESPCEGDVISWGYRDFIVKRVRWKFDPVGEGMRRDGEECLSLIEVSISDPK